MSTFPYVCQWSWKVNWLCSTLRIISQENRGNVRCYGKLFGLYRKCKLQWNCTYPTAVKISWRYKSDFRRRFTLDFDRLVCGAPTIYQNMLDIVRSVGETKNRASQCHIPTLCMLNKVARWGLIYRIAYYLDVFDV